MLSCAEREMDGGQNGRNNMQFPLQRKRWETVGKNEPKRGMAINRIVRKFVHKLVKN